MDKSAKKEPHFKCYFGCETKAPLHKFPKPEYPHLEKFYQWKKILGPSLQSKDDHYIYYSLRICDNHFAQCYRSLSKRLTSNAVPTLNLSTTYVAGTSSQENGNLNPESIDMEIQTRHTIATTSESVAGTSSQENENLNPESSDKKIQIRHTIGAARKRNLRIKQSGAYSKLKEKLLKLRAKCKNQTERIRCAERTCRNAGFLETIERLPEPAKVFITMQLKHNEKPKGRRYNMEEKILSLAIYKQSPRGYNLLSRLFTLPSKRLLQKLLSCMVIKTGINSEVMSTLKKKVDILPAEKRLCTLLFDEIALTAELYYDQQLDQITGFEDYGDNTNTNKLADHALVFMVKGIKGKFKQPVAFTFCQASTKATILKELIKKVVIAVTDAGLKIVATVCDQGSTNMSAINALLKESNEKYLQQGKENKSLAIEINDIKFFPIYDPPHLLKGIRNNFLNKNLRFVVNGEVMFAKWEHIEMLIALDDEEDDMRMLNKITDLHIKKDKIPKMKVKYAAQVFSHRVASTMRFMANRKLLPEECKATAKLLGLLDQLFDSFNGHTDKDLWKPLKGALKENSQHFKKWDEWLPILISMRFQTICKNKDGTEEIKYLQVPSLKNWIHNIHVFKEMVTYLSHEYQVKSILPRNFNQDPLEYFFRCIRSQGVRNVSPTCAQFINAYKALLVNNY